MTQKELEQKVIDAEGRVAKREAVLKANGYGELVKVEESTRWADLKKLLSYTGDIATLTETGEIVEGVTVYETPGIFTVDV